MTKSQRPSGFSIRVRLRASYRRTSGVRQMIAALDLATDQIFYRIREGKRWREFLHSSSSSGSAGQ